MSKEEERRVQINARHVIYDCETEGETVATYRAPLEAPERETRISKRSRQRTPRCMSRLIMRWAIRGLADQVERG